MVEEPQPPASFFWEELPAMDDTLPPIDIPVSDDSSVAVNSNNDNDDEKKLSVVDNYKENVQNLGGISAQTAWPGDATHKKQALARDDASDDKEQLEFVELSRLCFVLFVYLICSKPKRFCDACTTNLKPVHHPAHEHPLVERLCTKKLDPNPT